MKNLNILPQRISLILSQVRSYFDRFPLYSSKYLACGKVYKAGGERESAEFRINKFADFSNSILPLFSKYPIQGNKSLDFADFCKVAELMQKKAHLTADGLAQILLIKDEMNNGRKC
jgi:hypothetical protein